MFIQDYKTELMIRRKFNAQKKDGETLTKKDWYCLSNQKLHLRAKRHISISNFGECKIH